MDQNTRFQLRYKKLTAESLLRSLFCGLAAALVADFALGTVLWIIGIENLSLTLGLLCTALPIVTAVSGAIFYRAKFKPTALSNARRLDGTGLEERLVTMVEYQDSDNLMARLQREDAQKALDSFDEKTLKFSFSRATFVTLTICAVLGLGMSTVASLSAAGLLPNGREVADAIIPDPPPVYVPVSYIAEDGGYIEGEMEQLILFGENAEPVVAVPEEGYTFEGWDDGGVRPTRFDKEIDHPLVLTAIFLPIEDEGDDEGDEGDSGDSGEAPEEQEGDGDDGEQPGQEGEDGEENPSDSGGGKYSKENQIIDGETYYREFLEEYRDKIMEYLKGNTETLTEEERAIIEAYINIV